ncbi:cation diffusion facilitator family transporter [Curtobacterium flaccumfaciens]|uniref:cation diffusion facilitator family transporter n=1 Tax=Curtobacterium flaccumfaciens TaxID=2035 RepID=UPI00188C2B43|nr:cation diffusion facilitator family transporter [Curtobacterium flaccumfaciens]MBF4629275.1 cation transporter [Curtobacterium flaccumfaciens]
MAATHDHGVDAHAVNRKRLAIAFSITATILVAEVVGAIATNSLALLVDAAHMLTDAGGLATALVASQLARRPATAKRTWGFARAEVLSATAQAAILLAVGLFVLVEGVQRLFAPPEIASSGLLVFGVIGLAGNIASILVLAAGRNANFNLRAAFLEVVNDALGSVAVIVAAIVIAVTGWGGADAIAGLLIGVLILPRAFKLLRETVNVLLESTPTGLDLDDVRQHLLERDRVVEVHDLHASQIATGLPVLTAHVIVDRECFTDGTLPALLDDLQVCVAEHFDVSVEHSTFQLEPAGHTQHEHTPHS